MYLIMLPGHEVSSKKLMLINDEIMKLIYFKKGFSLLEVVIALLIISVTFLAYSQLIEQNLKAQDMKQDYLDEYQLKTNVLTIYTANPKIDGNQIQELLNLDSISEKQLSRYNALVEIEIEFKNDSNAYTIKIIK
jgi:prepilin-type N-terminal cleavage/methylation domain